MGGKEIKKFLSLITFVAFVSCDHPYQPVESDIFVYAPNTSVAVSYWENNGSGEVVERFEVIEPSEFVMHVGGIAGTYFKTDLNKHPKWGQMTIRILNEGGCVYVTPFKAVYINGYYKYLPQKENELESFGYPVEQVLDELTKINGWAIRIDDTQEHVVPVRSAWDLHSDDMVNYHQNPAPEIKL